VSAVRPLTVRIAEALGRYAGRRLLGVIDCTDCCYPAAIELVFDEESDERGWPGNLLTLYLDGRIAHGGVARPRAYVESLRPWWLPAPDRHERHDAPQMPCARGGGRP
jgi:hypothetical protein